MADARPAYDNVAWVIREVGRSNTLGKEFARVIAQSQSPRVRLADLGC